MSTDRYTFDFEIRVARFTTSSMWRAACRIGGMQVISAQANDPVTAVQMLFLKLGSGHENTDVGIEAALSGDTTFLALTDGSS